MIVIFNTFQNGSKMSIGNLPDIGSTGVELAAKGRIGVIACFMPPRRDLSAVGRRVCDPGTLVRGSGCAAYAQQWIEELRPPANGCERGPAALRNCSDFV